MAQLLPFLSHHPFLVSLFIVILIAWIALELWRLGAQQGIDVNQAILLLNREEAKVIDIREAADYRKGHIVNASNIPESRLAEELPRLKLAKERPLIVCCASGLRAPQAAKQVRAAGFEKVHVLKGGIQGWQEAGLPLERK